ncbi:MAG: DOMON-like domain-containing protein [Candidatus Dactylopiibacterium sp.]|nr:DOMON-like domain-containing protein [Candidatus Dactylopiibacterium sp.]
MTRLSPHPASPPHAALTAHARAARQGDELHLTFEVRAPAGLLRLPAPAARPAFTDGLWRHTCCEAFVGTPEAEAYREFNLSPSGDWAAYAFSAYRAREAWSPATTPRLHCSPGPAGFTLVATVPAELLPAGGDWSLGLSVVLEDRAGALAYFALHHAAPQPDFHARAARCLRLDRKNAP